jgi:hypothetical protein
MGKKHGHSTKRFFSGEGEFDLLKNNPNGEKARDVEVKQPVRRWLKLEFSRFLSVIKGSDK